jgi:hypothetical protein
MGVTYVRVRLRLLANSFLATHPHKWVNKGAVKKDCLLKNIGVETYVFI